MEFKIIHIFIYTCIYAQSYKVPEKNFDTSYTLCYFVSTLQYIVQSCYSIKSVKFIFVTNICMNINVSR